MEFEFVVSGTDNLTIRSWMIYFPADELLIAHLLYRFVRKMGIKNDRVLRNNANLGKNKKALVQ